ncbi:MAG: hypothetical protein OIF50_11260 [Flavobacteriaceae bacterium]|nr:hypothetical protein [Flavobacteriaceae bacterium]
MGEIDYEQQQNPYPTKKGKWRLKISHGSNRYFVFKSLTLRQKKKKKTDTVSHLEQCYCVVPFDIFDILVFISGVVSFDI